MKKTVLILACTLLAISACGKKGSSGSTAAATITYYQSDSTCYEVKTNKAVDIEKCDKVTYYMEYGSCYKKSDDSNVDMDNCTKSLSAYFYNNGSCIEKSTDSYVSDNLCTDNSLTSYGYNSNGQCIDKKTGKVVSQSNCEDDNSRYKRNGPICYDTYTGWSVDMYYCTGNTNTNSCIGDFVKVDQFGYFAGYITCNGSNCAGKKLFNPHTGDYVNCK